MQSWHISSRYLCVLLLTGILCVACSSTSDAQAHYMDMSLEELMAIDIYES